MKLNRARFTAGLAFAVLAAGLVPIASRGGLIGASEAWAQSPGQRVVTGKVVDDTETALPGATVFLKNLKSKSIRSFTSTGDGRFRFTQVNMTDDFELWAEKQGKKSPTKTVSSWDTRKEFEAELKVK